MVFIPQIQRVKARTGNNGSRIQAQALLDTGSLVGDFISQNLCLSLNALHLCYTSLIPLVVCSGLDGTCHSNNSAIDIGNNFKSINNVCHTIYLTVRVKQSSLIDLIIGRVSLNKYSFYKLTPFAFGISEEHELTSSVSVDCSTCDDLPDVEPLLSQRFTTILSWEYRSP